MLSAENVSRSYKKNRRKVLDNLNFSVKAGEFCAVMGASGSGKSTLLAVMAGLLKPDEGKVRYENEDIYAMPDRELSVLHREKIAYVPQSNIFLKNRTVLENIVSPYFENGEKGLKEKAEKLLERFKIAELADSFPHELSGGEQKRASLVRAMLNDPEILIADEPTTGLDSKTGKLILEILAEYAEGGRTVIAATHDAQASDFVGKVFLL